MEGHSHSSRYARLVALFAVSAFGLLMTLTIQLKEAGSVTASVARRSAVMTNYRQQPNCYVRTALHGHERVRITICRQR